MPQDRHVVLEKLRAELEFIESGGYHNPAHASWRPQFVFEDSPMCLNRDSTKPRRPCVECALMEFVPKGLAKERIPCRYIPLNDRGETIDSFYRSGTRDELEAAVAQWLTRAIKRLERESKEWQPAETPIIHVKAKFVGSR